MGAKISVDSATMMNKGLEVIEAHYLFGLAPDMLHAVIHPQSIVHALLAHHDGSVLAQMALPDMRIPIACALSWPERLPLNSQPLNLCDIAKLEFSPIDAARYPLYATAGAALKQGQASMIALNACNELAVQAFLEGRIGFLDISATVQHMLSTLNFSPIASIADVLAWDAEVRKITAQVLRRH